MTFKAKYLVPYKGLTYYADDAFDDNNFNSKLYTGLVAYNFVMFTVPSFTLGILACKGLDSLF